MAAETHQAPRFIRKTQLGAGEYRKNFLQIDQEVIEVITSPEADLVTPLMSKVYLRLMRAPAKHWEREGVLRFEAEWREEKHVKAWTVLCEAVGVASATASKALAWMHDQGIIGYFSGKNGVGLRIFLNRAASSIGARTTAGTKKILDFAPGSPEARRASQNEPAFNDSFAVRDNLDSDLDPHAPKNGADNETVDKKSHPPRPSSTCGTGALTGRGGREVEAVRAGIISAEQVEQLVRRLKSELEPCVKTAATQAASQAAAREVARTREWFETRALPKAVRVAQHETYGLLRKHGGADAGARRARADLAVGRAASDTYTPPVARELTPGEIREAAETCVALLETQGKSVNVTLAEISAEGGGWLLPEDALRVRAAALDLLRERSERR